MRDIPMQTRREMGRGWLSRTSIGMTSTDEAIDRMGTLLAIHHRSQGAVFFGEMDDDTLMVIVRDEKFSERASPDFPSEALVARVALAVRWNGNED